MGPNGILCTRWEKEYASVRQTFVACDDCLVKNEAYDAEEKAHTSKRVSIISCDNVISKAQLSGTPRDTVYSRGKGAHKQKTNNCRLRRLFGQKCSVRRGAMTLPPQLRWYCLLMCFRIKELWIVICVNFVAWGDFRPVRRVDRRVDRHRVARVVRPVCRSTARLLPLSFRSPKSLQEGFRPHTDYTCRWLRVRASTGLSPAPVF